MPLAFHRDLDRKFDQQYLNARHYVIPFIEEHVSVEGKKVLEIGCGEGGILKAFIERGCPCTGVDFDRFKIEFALQAFSGDIEKGRATVVARDIYEFDTGFENEFDIIVLKDTIEHIHDQEKLLRRIRDFLTDDGVIFIAFPPWRMPYGGHQQMSDSRLGKLPYYHLLPRKIYRRLLTLFGEDPGRIEGLMEIVDTRLSIGRFERLIRDGSFRTVKRRFYLVNPIYRFKFGIRPIRQLPVIRSMPWIRDFVTTTCFYLIERQHSSHRS